LSARALSPRSSHYRGIGFLLAGMGVLSFSLRPIFIKIAYSYVRDPVTLIALRMVFSLPFFMAAAWWTQRRSSAMPISKRDAWSIVGLGIVGYYAASFLDFLGLQYIGAGLARLVLFMYPTLVVLLSWLFLRKTPRGVEIAALLLTYIGLALVLARAVSGQNEQLALGAGLVFGSAIAYSIYLVAGTEIIRRVGAMRFSAYALMIASACCILQFFLLRPLDALKLPWPVYGLAILIAVVCTVLPVFMTAEALRRIGASNVAIMGALGPVSAMLLGYVGLDEVMNPTQIFGAMLVLLGVVLVTLKRV
jgi:drug/metabolite transporter (DMT)-like permease